MKKAMLPTELSPASTERPWKVIFTAHFQLPKAYTDLHGLSSPTAGNIQLQANVNQVHKYIFIGDASYLQSFSFSSQCLSSSQTTISAGYMRISLKLF